MAKIENYTELIAWQETRKLVNTIYSLSKEFPPSEQFALGSQVRRAAVSALSNLAEGCGRGTTKDCIHFLHISRGSLFEVESQLYVAYDQGFLKPETLELSLLQITSCKRLINGMLRYLKAKLKSN